MAVAAARDKTQTLAVQEKLRHEVELKKQEEAKKELALKQAEKAKAKVFVAMAVSSQMCYNICISMMPDAPL